MRLSFRDKVQASYHHCYKGPQPAPGPLLTGKLASPQPRLAAPASVPHSQGGSPTDQGPIPSPLRAHSPPLASRVTSPTSLCAMRGSQRESRNPCLQPSCKGHQDRRTTYDHSGQSGQPPAKSYKVMCACSVMSISVTPWTVAHQAPLPMAPSRQEYWSGLPRPPPGDLPDPGIEPVSLTSPALAGGFFTTSATWEGQHSLIWRGVHRLGHQNHRVGPREGRFPPWGGKHQPSVKVGSSVSFKYINIFPGDKGALGETCIPNVKASTENSHTVTA